MAYTPENNSYQDIFSYIASEEASYRALPITVTENYEWNMWKHITTTILYKNSQYLSGKDDNKPFKNIIRPILNLQYRAEGFDVKDIVLFVNEAKNYYKSFLIKKFHEKWARKNKIDTFIDELVESYVDFGGALVKNVGEIKPEVVPLQRIAFCDQTDILSGPICEKHAYSPSQLKEMAQYGWENIDDLIDLSKNYKQNNLTQGSKQTHTPGKYIEVYELHGCLPGSWLSDEYDYDEYIDQVHICAYYTAENGNKNGITLFKKEEKDYPYKLILRDKIYGRALGFGGAEELFEPQVWVNYDVIRMKEMLDAAALTILQTADTTIASKNNVRNLSNLSIIKHDDGKPLTQVDTYPRNMALFDNAVKEWEAHAQQMGAAGDAIMGESPTSGTPFRLQELVTQEAHSLHEYRKGKLATFLDEVYMDWIIPYISKEVTKQQEFISELDQDELQATIEGVVNRETEKVLFEKILNGETFTQQQVDVFRQQVREKFLKGGNKQIIKILEGEFKKAPIEVEVNIAGKQKYLSAKVDKLVNIFRTIIASPQVLRDPTMAKLFNQILEGSGLDPMDFSQMQTPLPAQPQQPAQQVAQQPIQQNATPQG